jgi:hypothetical protein
VAVSHLINEIIEKENDKVQLKFNFDSIFILSLKEKLPVKERKNLKLEKRNLV